MSESRLFKIIYYLLDKEQATAPELAEMFEVSVRTIYRDIDALSGAGIPIYTEAGRNGGIYLMNDFVLDRAVLSKEERQEILTALQSINIMQNVSSSQTLQKLTSIFNLHSENWLEIDFSRWGNIETDNEKFAILKTAIIRRKCIKIEYANSFGEISERIIEPLKIAYKSISWYLKAYCTQKKDYRIFKLTRIINLEMLEKSFSYHSFPVSEEVAHNDKKIVLRFAKEMAFRVFDEFDKTQVRQQENGEFIVTANMPEDDWLIGFLMSFGSQVEIIEPKSLKKIVAERAKKIYEKNIT